MIGSHRELINPGLVLSPIFVNNTLHRENVSNKTYAECELLWAFLLLIDFQDLFLQHPVIYVNFEPEKL